MSKPRLGDDSEAALYRVGSRPSFKILFADNVKPSGLKKNLLTPKSSKHGRHLSHNSRETGLEADDITQGDTIFSVIEGTPWQGSVRSFAPQGSVRSSAQQGSVRSSEQQGSVRSSAPQGSVRSSAPQGSVRSSAPQGSVRSSAPQGSVRSFEGDLDHEENPIKIHKSRSNVLLIPGLSSADSPIEPVSESSSPARQSTIGRQSTVSYGRLYAEHDNLSHDDAVRISAIESKFKREQRRKPSISSGRDSKEKGHGCGLDQTFKSFEWNPFNPEDCESNQYPTAGPGSGRLECKRCVMPVTRVKSGADIINDIRNGSLHYNMGSGAPPTEYLNDIITGKKRKSISRDTIAMHNQTRLSSMPFRSKTSMVDLEHLTSNSRIQANEQEASLVSGWLNFDEDRKEFNYVPKKQSVIGFSTRRRSSITNDRGSRTRLSGNIDNTTSVDGSANMRQYGESRAYSNFPSNERFFGKYRATLPAHMNRRQSSLYDEGFASEMSLRLKDDEKKLRFQRPPQFDASSRGNNASDVNSGDINWLTKTNTSMGDANRVSTMSSNSEKLRFQRPQTFETSTSFGGNSASNTLIGSKNASETNFGGNTTYIGDVTSVTTLFSDNDSNEIISYLKDATSSMMNTPSNDVGTWKSKRDKNSYISRLSSINDATKADRRKRLASAQLDGGTESQSVMSSRDARSRAISLGSLYSSTPLLPSPHFFDDQSSHHGIPSALHHDGTDHRKQRSVFFTDVNELDMFDPDVV